MTTVRYQTRWYAHSAKHDLEYSPSMAFPRMTRVSAARMARISVVKKLLLLKLGLTRLEYFVRAGGVPGVRWLWLNCLGIPGLE